MGFAPSGGKKRRHLNSNKTMRLLGSVGFLKIWIASDGMEGVGPVWGDSGYQTKNTRICAEETSTTVHYLPKQELTSEMVSHFLQNADSNLVLFSMRDSVTLPVIESLDLAGLVSNLVNKMEISEKHKKLCF